MKIYKQNQKAHILPPDVPSKEKPSFTEPSQKKEITLLMPLSAHQPEHEWGCSVGLKSFSKKINK